MFKGKHTTDKLYIGIPEAEAESNNKARVKFEDVFNDYLEVIPEIETEKFIVTGSKGSGKTAIGQYLYKQSKAEPNKFCDFVRKSDIDLEELIQFTSKKGFDLKKEILFKWIILVRILRLITQNHAVEDLKEIKLLRQFLKKNSGYVEINRFEIKEEIKNSGFSIFIEYLSRFFRAIGKKEFKLKGQKAPFYKLIPYLEDAILSVLSSQEDQFNSYYLIFDDLDIEFKASKKESIETLLNLIRIAKHYNNNFFSDNEINAKIILLLRDDISDVLVKKSADMAKVFASYGIPLVWYEHDLFKIDENLLKLKQFVDRRIERALSAKKIDIQNKNPWDYLIHANEEVNLTSFKYIIDHTFYNPRDLILLFKCAPSFKFKIPLKLGELNKLIGKYSEEMKGEIDNALAIHLSPGEIDQIWKVLKATISHDNYGYDFLINKIKQYKFGFDTDSIANLLFEYSLIGNKIPRSSKVIFKYRERTNENVKLSHNYRIINHRIVGIYFKNIDS